MNVRNPYQENGQALFEAIFIFMILATLLFSIQFTGQLRVHSLELLGQSSYLTFLQSNQNAVSQARTMPPQTTSAGLLNTFAEQLLDIRDQGMIKVLSKQSQTQGAQSMANRYFGRVSVERASYLYVNAGQSDTPSQAQSRIEHSKAAWRNTSLPTQTMLQAYIEPLAKADAPWHRSRLSTEWLGTWAGQSPGRLRLGTHR